MEQSVVDDIINRLLEVRHRPGKQVQLSEAEIRQLCVVSREIFLQQPYLLELEAPIKICGIHLFLFLSIIFFSMLSTLLAIAKLTNLFFVFVVVVVACLKIL
jgi:hypothetical protein